MIQLIRELVISCTAVMIFSIIILTIIGDENPQKEIIKIGIGCIMIITISTKLFGTNIKLENFSDIVSEIEDVSSISLEASNEMQSNYITYNIEKYVLEQTGIKCDIKMNEDFIITKVYVYNSLEFVKISELLGISTDILEYIESR